MPIYLYRSTNNIFDLESSLTDRRPRRKADTFSGWTKGAFYTIGTALVVFIAGDLKDILFTLQQINDKETNIYSRITAHKMDKMMAVEERLIDSLYDCISSEIRDSTPHQEIRVRQAERIIKSCVWNIMSLSFSTYIEEGYHPLDVYIVEEVNSSIYDTLFPRVKKDFFKIYNRYYNGMRIGKIMAFTDHEKAHYKTLFTKGLYESYKKGLAIEEHLK